MMLVSWIGLKRGIQKIAVQLIQLLDECSCPLNLDRWNSQNLTCCVIMGCEQLGQRCITLYYTKMHSDLMLMHCTEKVYTLLKISELSCVSSCQERGGPLHNTSITQVINSISVSPPSTSPSTKKCDISCTPSPGQSIFFPGLPYR